MPQMLSVTALELCDPLMLVILMVANDPTFRNHGTPSS